MDEGIDVEMVGVLVRFFSFFLNGVMGLPFHESIMIMVTYVIVIILGLLRLIYYLVLGESGGIPMLLRNERTTSSSERH